MDQPSQVVGQTTLQSQARETGPEKLLSMYCCDFRGMSQDSLGYRKLAYGLFLQKNKNRENELLSMKGLQKSDYHHLHSLLLIFRRKQEGQQLAEKGDPGSHTKQFRLNAPATSENSFLWIEDVQEQRHLLGLEEKWAFSACLLWRAEQFKLRSTDFLPSQLLPGTL